jgi:hypothetical protein
MAGWMENAVTDTTEESDDLDWRAIMESLANGNAVDIPFDNEKEGARRERQVAKRAERNGLAVAVQRSESALRVEPRGALAAPAAAPAAAEKSDEDRESREERRQERAQRREAAKAERGAAREG